MKFRTCTGVLLMTLVAGQAIGQTVPVFRSWYGPGSDAASNSRIVKAKVDFGSLSAVQAAEAARDELLTLPSSESFLMIQNFASASGFQDPNDYHVTALPANTRGFNLWYQNGIVAARGYIGDMLDEFSDLQDMSGSPPTFNAPELIILDEEEPIAVEYWNWNCVVGIAQLDDIDSVIYTNSNNNYPVYGFAGKTSVEDIVTDNSDLYVDLTKVNWETYCVPTDYPDGVDGRPDPTIINVANWLQAQYPTYNKIGDSPSVPLYIDHTRKYLGVAWHRVAQQVRAASLEEGLIKPLQDGSISSTDQEYDWGPDLKWSNYDTSISLDNGGSAGVELYFKGRSYEDTRGASKFFWDGAGSFDSPVLYPKSNCYAVGSEDRMDATLRIDRDNLNAIAECETGNGDRAIMPWVLTADLVKDEYYITDSAVNCGNPPISSFVATKSFFRDMVAMCRAKGVTEYILWGQRHGDTPYATLNQVQKDERDDAWDATSEAINQVWDYQLDNVSVTTGIGTPTTLTQSAEYSDQNALQAKIDTGGSSITIKAEFSKASGTATPSHLALIAELDEGALTDRTLEIFDHCANSWDPVSGAPIQISQGRWEEALDYSILRWEIDVSGSVPLNCPSNMFSVYIDPSDGSIDLRLTYSGNPDEVAEIDLMQLYAVDSPPAPATFEDGLGQILTAFEGDRVSAGEKGDFNGDGRMNKIEDLIALIEQFKARR